MTLGSLFDYPLCGICHAWDCAHHTNDLKRYSRSDVSVALEPAKKGVLYITVKDYLSLHPKSTFDLLTEYGYIPQVGGEQLGTSRGVVTSASGSSIPSENILAQNVIGVVEQNGGTMLYTGRNSREAMYQEEPHDFVQTM